MANSTTSTNSRSNMRVVGGSFDEPRRRRPAPVLLVVVVAAAALAVVVLLQLLQPAAAFVVVVPGFGLVVPRQQQQHQQQQQGLASWNGGRRLPYATAYRARSVAAAAARASSTAAVTPEAEERPRRSLDELLTEIRENAGTPQVLSLLKEAVAATGTGEVKREFFKVRFAFRVCHNFVKGAVLAIDSHFSRTAVLLHISMHAPPQAIFPFPLDDFQLKALEALGRRENVIVSAPTGSGRIDVAG
jgi:hypothetical protein